MRNRPIPPEHSCLYVARRNVIVDAAWAEASGLRPAPGEPIGAYDRRVQAFVIGLIEAKLWEARVGCTPRGGLSKTERFALHDATLFF